MPPAATEDKKFLATNTQVSRVRFGDGLLAAAGHDATIRLFDVSAAEAKEAKTITGHDGWVSDLAFDATGKVLFSCDSWGRVCSWDSSGKKLWEQKSAHAVWVRKLSVSPDGKTLATADRSGVVRLWKTESGEKCGEISAEDDVLSLVHRPKGDLLIGDLHGRVRVWKSGDKALSQKLEATELYLLDRIQDVGGVRAMAFDASGKFLAVAGAQPKTGGFVQAIPHLFVYDWESGERKHTWKGANDNEGYIHDLGWHASGFVFSVTSGQPGQGKLMFWKPGEAKPHFEVSKPNCHSVSLNRDGTRLAISATNANSSGNGRVKGRDGEYPANVSPIYFWNVPKGEG